MNLNNTRAFSIDTIRHPSVSDPDGVEPPDLQGDAQAEKEPERKESSGYQQQGPTLPDQCKGD